MHTYVIPVEDNAPILVMVIAVALTDLVKATPASDSTTQNGAFALAVAKVITHPVAIEPSVTTPAVSVLPAEMAGEVPHEEREGAVPSVAMSPFTTNFC